MILRGINFGPVLQASGATNFHGKGWWYHKPLHFFGLNFRGSTIVTKTTTFLARPGNMPLKPDGVTPKEWLPRCIIVNRRKKVALNAVSLSGPGLNFLINALWWQNFTEPFLISVMSLQKTAEGRLAELQAIFHRLSSAKQYEQFRADWGVQLNFSCPNGGIDPKALIDEVIPTLEMAEKSLSPSVPLMLKFGPDVHPESIVRIANHPRCDAICVFNTLPYGKHPTWAKVTAPIDWKSLFGSDSSPMEKRFPGFAGGLSGAPLKPFLLEWLTLVRVLGVTKQIVAGGGLLSANDAKQAFDAGANAVSPGSIAMLAPTQVRPMILGAHRYARQRNQKPAFDPSVFEYNV